MVILIERKLALSDDPVTVVATDYVVVGSRPLAHFFHPGSGAS